MKTFINLATLFMLLPALLQAQTSGALKGTVTDTAGAPIAGATVTVLGTSRGAITRPDGTYLIAGLQTSDYTVKIERSDKTYIQQQVAIQPHVVSTLDITWHPDSASHNTVVNADTSLILRVSAGPVGTVTRLIQEGPNPGFRISRREGASIRRDGIHITDPQTQDTVITSSPTVPTEHAQTGGGFEAEYGSQLNGVVDTTTSVPDSTEQSNDQSDIQDQETHLYAQGTGGGFGVHYGGQPIQRGCADYPPSAQTPDVAPYTVDYAEVTLSGFEAEYGEYREHMLCGVVCTYTQAKSTKKSDDGKLRRWLKELWEVITGED